MRSGKWNAGGTGGQSLVEFALVVPLLILLVIGVAELGRAWMSYNVVVGAARESVRVAAVNSLSTTTDTAWAGRAQAIMASASLTGPAPQITEAGDSISVTVTCNFTPVISTIIRGPGGGSIPLLPGLGGTIQLSSTATMRKEY